MTVPAQDEVVALRNALNSAESFIDGLTKYVRHHSTCAIAENPLPIALAIDKGCTCGASDALKGAHRADVARVECAPAVPQICPYCGEPHGVQLATAPPDCPTAQPAEAGDEPKSYIDFAQRQGFPYCECGHGREPHRIGSPKDAPLGPCQCCGCMEWRPTARPPVLPSPSDELRAAVDSAIGAMSIQYARNPQYFPSMPEQIKLLRDWVEGR